MMVSSFSFFALFTEIPDDGPVIYGGQTHYHVGDTMNVTCMYTRQGKPVSLQWLLNDEEVPARFLVQYHPKKLSQGRFQTALGLQFIGKRRKSTCSFSSPCLSPSPADPTRRGLSAIRSHCSSPQIAFLPRGRCRIKKTLPRVRGLGSRVDVASSLPHMRFHVYLFL